MTAIEILLGILLFALAVALLYLWGLQKSLHQKEDMQHALLHAAGARVLRHLKKHATVNKKEVASLIEGTKVGPFWSKQRILIQDGSKTADAVLTFLLEQQYIEAAEKGTYRRKR